MKRTIGAILKLSLLSLIISATQTAHAEVIGEGSETITTKMKYIKVQTNVICVVTKNEQGQNDSAKLVYSQDDREAINNHFANGYSEVKLPFSERCSSVISNSTLPTIVISAGQDIDDVVYEQGTEYKNINIIMYDREEFYYQLNQSMKSTMKEIFNSDSTQS